MKRRMYWSICITSLCLVLLATGLTLWSAYGLLVRQARVDLVHQHRVVARSLEFLGGDGDDFLKSLDGKLRGFRATVIGADGEVLFDTDNNSDGMENHRSRPEIIAALQDGMGTDVRRSETMGLNTLYYAERLPDGNVLRVSSQTRTIGAVFAGIVPLMAAIMLAVVVISVWTASRLTRRLLKPIERLAGNIGDAEGIDRYEELEPFLLKIREQNRLIGQQLDRLREERDTVQAITSNMKEGLVLLDQEKLLLSVNRSAMMLLGAGSADYTGKHLLVLSRSVELGDCARRALAGETADALFECGGRICQLFASPVQNSATVWGAVLLILDVTDQQRAEKIRRDFTANVSHELKTPLTSISGFAEMIENGMVASEADVKKFAGRIYREASRLITLTDDIIRLSRIEESGQADLEPVDLLAVARGVAVTLGFAAQQKAVTLNVSGTGATVLGSARMLEELIYNLAENAIKYNGTDGQVDIGVRQDGDMAVVTVSDTGIGIDGRHQERIFERFYRVDKSRSKQTGGTGLGLSIVKHIVERHGGQITLVSAPNEGTTVTARIPVRPI